MAIAALVDVATSDSNESKYVGRSLLDLRAGAEVAADIRAYNVIRKACQHTWSKLTSLSAKRSVNTASRLTNLTTKKTTAMAVTKSGYTQQAWSTIPRGPISRGMFQ